eukprot:9242005-Pyramimonas_sp.AAC.2
MQTRGVAAGAVVLGLDGGLHPRPKCPPLCPGGTKWSDIRSHEFPVIIFCPRPESTTKLARVVEARSNADCDVWFGFCCLPALEGAQDAARRPPRRIW